MKMPDRIDDIMLAPCGMNCEVCYKHVGIKMRGKPCEGCLKGDLGKPEHCRQCQIKSCAQKRGFKYCYECGEYPCKLIKNLDKSYRQRYSSSLVENCNEAKRVGVTAFLAEEQKKWTCPKCGGAFSLHDGECSECGNKNH